MRIVGTFGTGTQPFLQDDGEERQREDATGHQHVPDAVVDDPGDKRQVVLKIIGRIERHRVILVIRAATCCLPAVRGPWLLRFQGAAIASWSLARVHAPAADGAGIQHQTPYAEIIPVALHPLRPVIRVARHVNARRIDQAGDGNDHAEPQGRRQEPPQAVARSFAHGVPLLGFWIVSSRSRSGSPW
jgi:hypothetical protein